LLEVAAQADVRQSQDVFNLVNASDLDSNEGIALERIGRDERIPKYLIEKATGLVTIGDSTFTKKSTRIYQGGSSPIVGSVAIAVESTVSWPASGQVYLGRNTSNSEGPLAYSSITDNGSYFTLNLSAPTTRFHNKGESVVLAQGGDRVIGSGTVVQTSGGSLSGTIAFSTLYEAVIQDGETEVSGIDVVALAGGIAGNVPASSVVQFGGGAPFSGATVTNDKPFINGRDVETDNDYRIRIRAVRNSRSLGTDLAITTAVVGAIDVEESKRISSASIARRSGEPAVLYIDDGTGYEEADSGVGIEVLEDYASGGERDFQVISRPVAKAYIETAATAPFALTDSAQLRVDVGGVETTHTFDVSEFISIEAASAYEVVASLNANPNFGCSARTIDNGSRVALTAKSEENDDLKAVEIGGPLDANAILLFQTSRHYTTLLYKNDQLLSKDGSYAALVSNPFVEWNFFSGDQTLHLTIDQTNETFYSFVDQDFVDAETGFNTVGKNDLDSWATVLNRKIPGITATVKGDTIVLTSNLGRSKDAKVEITSGTLVAQRLFSASVAYGSSRDYWLDRGTGQIVTAVGLEAGDRLTLGSEWTRAFVGSDSLAPTTTASVTSTWWSSDGNCEIIPHGVGQAIELTATIEGVNTHSVKLAVEATTDGEAFANIRTGDFAVFWDPTSNLPASLRKAWRVTDIELDGDDLRNKLILEKPAAASGRIAAAAVALVPSGGDLSKILVCGGYTSEDGGSGNFTHFGRGCTEEVEIYDPNLATWTSAGPMSVARAHHTASILPDGKVLVCGGFDRNDVALNTTEIWDPGTGLWTAGPTMAVARAAHSATVLASGRVLVAGGLLTATTVTDSTQEYNQGTNTFINASTMGTARAGHGAVLLPSGAGGGAESNNVLVIGGISGTAPLTSVERYNVSTFAWSAKTALATGRSFFGSASVATEKVLIVGDSEYNVGYSNNLRDSYQVYDVAANTWTASAVVETGWRFTDKRYGLGRCATNGVAIAYGGVYESAGIKSLRHKKFDGGALTWSTLADSPFAKSGVERTQTLAVAITGGASPDRVWFYGGVSQGNTAANNTSGTVVATSETWNDDTAAWEVLDDSKDFSADVLANRGLTFVRASTDLEFSDIPTGSSYTASTLADALNADLDGITASVYRTSRLRVETNSYGVGDICLVAESQSLLGIESEVPVTSAVGHFGSTESRGTPTPIDFQIHSVAGHVAAHTADATETLHFPHLENSPYDIAPLSTSVIKGLRRTRDGLNPRWWQAAWVTDSDLDKSTIQYGNTKNSLAPVAALDIQATRDRFRAGFRSSPHQTFGVGSPVIFEAPRALGHQDTLVTVIDNDTDTKRYVIPMGRRVKPTSNVYSSQITVSDTDNAANTLATAFGLDYDFDDFAVFMSARGKSHSATASKRTLWRYFRKGPDGNDVVVRYMYPDAADSELAVTTEYDQTSVTNYFGVNTAMKAFVNIVLGSGAEKAESTFTSAGKIGLARCNQTSGVWDVYIMTGFEVIEAERLGAAAQTRLRIQVPNNGVVAQGPQDSGIFAGDVLWFEAVNPGATTLYSGSFTVASTGAFNLGTGTQDIWIPADTLHDSTSAMGVTANPGTLSHDTAGEVLFDTSAIAGDLVRIEPNSTWPTEAYEFTSTTMRAASVGRQYLRCRSLDPEFGGLLTAPTWNSLGNTEGIKIFGAPTQTATAVVAAVNAITSSPVTGTITGTGSGVIDKATWDELDLNTANYPLSDGLNWVQRTIEPPNVATHTQLLLKDAISADLLNDADWVNEEVVLAPALTEGVVRWLKTPTISGLFSAADVVQTTGRQVSIASLTPGSGGSVEIQGGTANSATAAVSGVKQATRNASPGSLVVTTRQSETSGFLGGRYVKIDNSSFLPKASSWNNFSTVNSISADGKWTLDVTPYVLQSNVDEVRVEIEKDGDYTAIKMSKTASASLPSMNVLVENEYIYLCAPTLNRSDLDAVGSANTGARKIIRATQNSDMIIVWVENPNSVDEVAVARVKVLTSYSMISGDSFVVSTAAFGDTNRGTWTINEVGAATPGGEQYIENSFYVDISTNSPGVLSSPVLMGTDANHVQLRQGTLTRLYKKILAILPNQDDSDFVDIIFTSSQGYAEVSASAGSIVSALDKLDFPLGLASGVDGYRHNTGLIQEANSIVYGRPEAPTRYPAIASGGAQILIHGPKVKRIRLALSLRVKSGSASNDIAEAVRNAVAAVINQTGVGSAISISDIINAASQIPGVTAVSVVSPVFSSTQDTIKVGASEKPLVLDLTQDISISFIGD
jgi:hypothetical protein